MDIYLPIAEISVNLGLILTLGFIAGFLSGMFGIGGAFVVTPILIFIGISPAVAVASQANQLVGASLSGVIGYWRRDAVDFKIGAVLVIGGLAGSLLGVWLFSILQRYGQVDIGISLLYVVTLGGLGGFMFLESMKTMLKSGEKAPAQRRLHQHYWLHYLPFKMRFPKSRLYISVLSPLLLGLLGGILTAILGVGGGFLNIPAMVYLLGMPSLMVPGTSLFQITFVAAIVTILQALSNHTVDLMLALLLLIGGVIGAQFGTRIGTRMSGFTARILLSIMMLGVAARLVIGLVLRPDSLFSLTIS